MAILTVRNLPEEVHRALRVRAAVHGRSGVVGMLFDAGDDPEDRLRIVGRVPESCDRQGEGRCDESDAGGSAGVGLHRKPRSPKYGSAGALASGS